MSFKTSFSSFILLVLVLLRIISSQTVMDVLQNFIIFAFLIVLLASRAIIADVGTAASFGPPYMPTVCYGSDTGQFPADNLFAAVGEGIWDNGAACGRLYLVRCLSSVAPGTCTDDGISDSGPTIQVVVVDFDDNLHSDPSMNGTTMVLSEAAFQMIASSSASEVNIEFTQILNAPSTKKKYHLSQTSDQKCIRLDDPDQRLFQHH